MIAIETKYIGPTNFRGSRIKASCMEPAPRRSITISYPDELNTSDAHAAAVKALITKLGWTSENGYGDWIVGSTERGIVAVCKTKHGDSTL